MLCIMQGMRLSVETTNKPKPDLSTTKTAFRCWMQKIFAHPTRVNYIALYWTCATLSNINKLPVIVFVSSLHEWVCVQKWTSCIDTLPCVCLSGSEPANLLSQTHLSWIICCVTPDTFMLLTRRLPTIALPNGLRPPILWVSVVDQLNPFQEQTRLNWPHMFFGS